MTDLSSIQKATVAWAGVGLAKLGIYTWSDAAAVVATVYSLLLIGEWVWKRIKEHRA